MQKTKRVFTVLILILICFILCGFVNESATRSEFQILSQLVIVKDLHIPKINISSNIYPDVSYLDKGVCYWRNAIIGHNLPNTGFDKLKLLKIGDILYYKNVKYILAEIKKINKEQVKVVTESEYLIILFTCYYTNKDVKRLVLFFNKEELTLPKVQRSLLINIKNIRR